MTLLEKVIALENLELACEEVLVGLRRRKSKSFKKHPLLLKAKEVRKINTEMPLLGLMYSEIRRAVGHIRKDQITDTYQRAPLRLCPIPKKSGGHRYLMLHGKIEDKILERAVYRIIGPLLHDILDNGVSYCGIPRLKGAKKTGIFPAHQGISAILVAEDKWLVKADIEKFFDKLQRDRVLNMLEMHLADKSLMPFFQEWVEVQLSNLKSFPDYPDPIHGIPQGSCLSGMIANLYLTQFDDDQMSGSAAAMIRYADDLFFACDTPALAEEVKNSIEQNLYIIGLNLKDSKVEIIQPGGSFEVLGYEYFGKEHSVSNNKIDEWIQVLSKDFIAIEKIARKIKKKKKIKFDEYKSLVTIERRIIDRLKSYGDFVLPRYLESSSNKKFADYFAKRRMGAYLKSASRGINRSAGKKILRIRRFSIKNKSCWPYVFPEFAIDLSPYRQ